MRLHSLLKSYKLFNGAGQRPAYIYDIEYLQSTRLKIHKVLMIAAQCSCTDVIAADVEHDRVPLKNEGRGDLSRKRERFDTRAGIVRRY